MRFHTSAVVSVFACSMTLVGCAHHPARKPFHPVQHKVGSAPVHARGADDDPGQRRPRAQERWPDAALLAPQPAPDCEFKGGNVEAVDATELARLKTEYERQCYQNAEKAARDRLGLLQDALQRIRN
jgi:hypothetical protein